VGSIIQSEVKDFLNVRNKIDWSSTFYQMEEYLGINKTHKLNKYIIDIFINIKDMKYRRLP
jgi:hypothetical protein